MREESNNKSETAVVIATYSREMALKRPGGEVVRARIKGKKLKPVCGDMVIAEPLENEPEWLITEIEKRKNRLTRPNMRGQTEILASNIDFLCVAASCKPPADWFIVDRYLCAAELMGVDGAVIYNKIDLDPDGAMNELEEYARLGYATLRCSAISGQGMDELRALLANRVSIIVGQSGVGKSSLINYLLGNERQRTADVSDATGEGRHTTVNSAMIDVGNNGEVIDSPGVRDYAPAIQTGEQVANGYREISDARQRCRFSNCLHMKEPDCAVKEGVESGSISKRRYDSYRRLMVLTEQLVRKGS